MKWYILAIVLFLTGAASFPTEVSSSELSTPAERVERVLAIAPQSSPKPEEMKCYPMTTVKKWAARKKKKVEPKVVEKIVEKQVVVEKEVLKDAPKNSLSLIAGRTETGLATHSAYPNFSTTTTGEFDAGLMYQRRFGKYRAGVIGTINGSFYGTIGRDFNFPGE